MVADRSLHPPCVLHPIFVHRPRNNAALVISLGEIRDGKWAPDRIVRKIRCRI
jgi:hypothetical protein